jgi:hypothetical protein
MMLWPPLRAGAAGVGVAAACAGGGGEGGGGAAGRCSSTMQAAIERAPVKTKKRERSIFIPVILLPRR